MWVLLKTMDGSQYWVGHSSRGRWEEFFKFKCVRQAAIVVNYLNGGQTITPGTALDLISMSVVK